MRDNYVGMWTLTKRELSRVFRVWKQTLVPPVVTAVLFILIFGYSLGSQITEIGGVSYLQFIVPGLLMMGVITSAYSNASSSLYLSKFQGNAQEWLVSPMSYWQIIAALTIGSVVRAFIVGLSVMLVAFFLSGVVVANVWILLLFLLFVSLIFSFAGIITGLWATSFDKMTVFSVFLITPLTYLGGVFYSIEMLPLFWQNVAKFNPILYMVDGFRYGFIGVSDIPLVQSLAVVIILTLGFFVASVYLFSIGYNLRN